MFLKTQKKTDFRRTAANRWPIVIGALLMLVMARVPLAGAQQRNNNENNNKKTSDLAIQNFSRVAASAAQVKSILLKDSGLMVELKRWVAKDATDHGQIVSDSDLTDDAMFERLETDVQFRSVATLLVQTIWISHSTSKSRFRNGQGKSTAHAGAHQMAGAASRRRALAWRAKKPSPQQK